MVQEPVQHGGDSGGGREFAHSEVIADEQRHSGHAGEVSVIEANSSGTVWHLSSRLGISLQREHGIDLYSQFGALDRAAERLIEITRQHEVVSPIGSPRLPFKTR